MRPLSSIVAPAVLLGALLWSAAPAAASVVTFTPGQATFLTDGRVGCIVGVNDKGVGSVTCAGPDVYGELWAGTPCDARTKWGCTDDAQGIKSIRLTERGKSKRAWIDGVGGVIGTERGDTMVLGKIQGRHLATGGFSFTNSSDHGFTLTKDRLRRF